MYAIQNATQTHNGIWKVDCSVLSSIPLVLLRSGNPMEGRTERLVPHGYVSAVRFVLPGIGTLRWACANNTMLDAARCSAKPATCAGTAA